MNLKTSTATNGSVLPALNIRKIVQGVGVVAQLSDAIPERVRVRVDVQFGKDDDVIGTTECLVNLNTQ